MILENWQLVLCLTGACTGLFLMFGWLFILRRSPLTLVFLFIRQWVNRDHVGLDAPIEIPERRPRFQDVIAATHAAAPAMQPEVVEQAGYSPLEFTPAPLSAQAAPELPPYPRPLSEAERDNPRPFLTMSLDQSPEDQA